MESTLTFSPIGSHTFGDAPFAISASSTSKGPISYSALSGPAIVSGNMVTLKGAGSVVLLASQAPDATFPAQTAKTVVTVNPAPSLLAFAAILAHTFGDPAFAVTASSASNGAISYSIVSGPATFSDNLVTLTGIGTVTIRASQVADANYAAQIATASFAVTASISATAKQAFVEVGGTDQFIATKDGSALPGGQWVVMNGSSNGTIDSDGTYHAPIVVPTPVL